MTFFEMLPRLAEVPLIALLAVVVLALAWTLTRVLAFLPRLPNAIVDAMSQVGQESVLTFQQTIDELQGMLQGMQAALREERERLDKANDEIDGLKQRLAAVDSDRLQAIRERDAWQEKASELEAQVCSLKAQIEQLSRQVEELDGRLAA